MPTIFLIKDLLLLYHRTVYLGFWIAGLTKQDTLKLYEHVINSEPHLLD